MRASVDHRTGMATLVMPAEEFTETVEWLETLSPHDGCTRDWREEHDRVVTPLWEGSDADRS